MPTLEENIATLTERITGLTTNVNLYIEFQKERDARLEQHLQDLAAKTKAAKDTADIAIKRLDASRQAWRIALKTLKWVAVAGAVIWGWLAGGPNKAVETGKDILIK